MHKLDAYLDKLDAQAGIEIFDHIKQFPITLCLDRELISIKAVECCTTK